MVAMNDTQKLGEYAIKLAELLHNVQEERPDSLLALRDYVNEFEKGFWKHDPDRQKLMDMAMRLRGNTPAHLLAVIDEIKDSQDNEIKLNTTKTLALLQAIVQNDSALSEYTLDETPLDRDPDVAGETIGTRMAMYPAKTATSAAAPTPPLTSTPDASTSAPAVTPPKGYSINDQIYNQGWAIALALKTVRDSSDKPAAVEQFKKTIKGIQDQLSTLTPEDEVTLELKNRLSGITADLNKEATTSADFPANAGERLKEFKQTINSQPLFRDYQYSYLDKDGIDKPYITKFGNDVTFGQMLNDRFPTKETPSVALVGPGTPGAPKPEPDAGAPGAGVMPAVPGNPTYDATVKELLEIVNKSVEKREITVGDRQTFNEKLTKLPESPVKAALTQINTQGFADQTLGKSSNYRIVQPGLIMQEVGKICEEYKDVSSPDKGRINDLGIEIRTRAGIVDKDFAKAQDGKSGFVGSHIRKEGKLVANNNTEIEIGGVKFGVPQITKDYLDEVMTLRKQFDDGKLTENQYLDEREKAHHVFAEQQAVANLGVNGDAAAYGRTGTESAVILSRKIDGGRKKDQFSISGGVIKKPNGVLYDPIAKLTEIASKANKEIVAQLNEEAGRTVADDRPFGAGVEDKGAEVGAFIKIGKTNTPDDTRKTTILTADDNLFEQEVRRIRQEMQDALKTETKDDDINVTFGKPANLDGNRPKPASGGRGM